MDRCGFITRARALCWKPKGADRKLKLDREKTDKRSPQDREKYQLSHDTTLLKEVRPRVPHEFAFSTAGLIDATLVNSSLLLSNLI